MSRTPIAVLVDHGAVGENQIEDSAAWRFLARGRIGLIYSGPPSQARPETAHDKQSRYAREIAASSGSAGEDAPSFLQGLLTNDVERLEPGEARYAALLSPQGKILFDMLVVRVPSATGAAFLIDCAAAQAADLARRLGFYKLRAKVVIADESADNGVVAGWGGEPRTPGRGLLPRSARASSGGAPFCRAPRRRRSGRERRGP